MKNSIIYIGLFGLLFLGSCKKYEDPGFLDAPTTELLVNPTLDDLVLLTKGVEAQAKVDIEMYVDIVGAIGREAFDLNGIDPRYTGELLGAENGPLDPGGFLTTRSYAARYKTVLQANNVLTGLENTTASLSDAQVNSFKGFVNTMKANALQMNLNTQYDNGIRIDTEDPANQGPFLSREDSQEAIRSLLDVAYTQLTSGGSSFPFDLGSGFSHVSTPSEFAKFNRGLAAKAALYSGDESAALTAIGLSFMDLADDMSIGGYLSYNVADNINNPLNHTAKFMAHPSFIDDAAIGDNRLLKTQLSLTPVSFDGLTSDYRANIYLDNGANVSIIRNEELILIFAEASVVSNSADAINAINTVRNAAGIGNYTGGVQQAELMDEIATQRRYSLFGEGHRWIDMRRWNRLDELPLDRENDSVHTQFPRPFGE
ncbi:MAG: hypothetical protein ACI8XB_002459 [Patiriisocius sp.]|jgi:hypothetical protein